MNKRKVGTRYEERAADFLVRKGYRILERNYLRKTGEIDLIAREGRYLAFVEVKYRRDSHMGAGGEAVDARKQRRIFRTALWYLAEQQLPEDTPCRFDVVTVTGEETILIQDAFQMRESFW